MPCPHPPKPLLPAVAQLSLVSSPSPGLGQDQSRAWEAGHGEEGPPVPTHGSPRCHGPRRLCAGGSDLPSAFQCPQWRPQGERERPLRLMGKGETGLPARPLSPGLAGRPAGVTGAGRMPRPQRDSSPRLTLPRLAVLRQVAGPFWASAVLSTTANSVRAALLGSDPGWEQTRDLAPQ